MRQAGECIGNAVHSLCNRPALRRHFRESRSRNSQGGRNSRHKLIGEARERSLDLVNTCLGLTQRCKRFLGHDRPSPLRRVRKPVQFRATIFQQRDQKRGVSCHRFHVERQVLLRCPGLLQRVHVKLQRLRTRQLAEHFSGNANLGRDVLKEVCHWPAARGHEVANAVVHVLENVGHLFGGNARRSRRRSPALKLCRAGVADLGKSLDFLRRLDCRHGDASESRSGRT